jgi:hypothetical protein
LREERGDKFVLNPYSKSRAQVKVRDEEDEVHDSGSQHTTVDGAARERKGKIWV